ncbi:MAG: helix-turn-helix transcriptional regulator [Ruminococcus sp.]|nr:helix-turn-helix transcriptional regulator [Ruminococcus sp.]
MDYITNDKNIVIEMEEKAKTVSDEMIDRLVAYRKQIHMTQQDIADATGMKRANIARIEGKKHLITLECLIKYAESMNLELCMELKEKDSDVE